MALALTHRTQQVLSLLRLTPFGCNTEEERAKERHRRALLTSAAAAAAKLVSVISLLLTVPLTLGYLGPERYGMWMTISSMIAMMAFADFGIGNGLLNAVSGAYGKNDIAAIRRHVASAYLMLGGIALAILIVLALAYDAIAWADIFNVTSATARGESGPAAATFICCFALNIPLSIIQRVQTGLQQGFTTNLWQCLGSLLGLAGIVTAVYVQAPLPWLVAAAVGLPMLGSVANTVHFFGFARTEMMPRAGEVETASIRRLAGTGFMFFVTQIAIALAYLSDNLVIARVLGPEAVTQFAVSEKMFSLVAIPIVMALSPLWPAYGEAIARGDRAWIRKTLMRSLRLAGGVAAILSLFLIVTGPTLISLWVGHAVSVSLPLLLALGAWKVTEAIGNAIAMYMNGMGMIRIQAILGIVMAISAVCLKIVLVGTLGVAGATTATLICYCAIILLPLAWIIPDSLRSTSRER